jgi:predicted AAA+ superfamily ATPase
MKRNVVKQLTVWQKKTVRKPLILQGARQVGKTYTLKRYAKESFSGMHYFDLEKSRDEFISIFEGKNLDPHEIIKKLEFTTQRRINIKKDVVIFDELQAIPRAITSLKYFQEEMPDLAIMTAGSNLGVVLTNSPFPVGKVECISMYPMNFLEFLEGTGENAAYEFITEFSGEMRIDDFYHSKLLDLLKRYFVTGGLPEVVDVYRKNKNNQLEAFSEVRKLQEQLILHYERDFSKYSDGTNARHIERVFRAVPAQLSLTSDKNSPKFKFKNVISEGFRCYETLADPIDWLVKAGLVVKLPIIEHPAIPLKQAVLENKFKLMMFDIGLLGSMVNLSPQTIINYNYGSYKGYFVENFVLSELVSYGYDAIANWQGRTSEVEFVLESNGRIIPIEVKSWLNTKAKSLAAYIAKYSPELAVKFTAKKYGTSGVTRTYPLYMVSTFRDLEKEVQICEFRGL